MSSQPAERLINSVLCSLEPELVVLVLDHLLEKTTLSFHDSGDIFDVAPRYTPPDEIYLFPQPYLFEAERRLHQRWLRSEKSFRDPWEFCVLSILLLAHKKEFAIPSCLSPFTEHTVKLPPAMSPHPALPLHGLEKIRLDLASGDYFALFKVRVPPFDDELLETASSEAFYAASFLKPTKELTICFSSLYRSCHPWYSLEQTEWDEPDEDGTLPRLRPNLCTAGLHIDWILSYAWHHNLIQHIPIVKSLAMCKRTIR